MKQIFKKIISTLGLSIILSASSILSVSSNISASEVNDTKEITNIVINEYNEILKETGTPEDVLNSFSEKQKEWIVTHLGEDAVYESSQSCILDMEEKQEKGGKERTSNLSKNLVQVTVSSYSMVLNGQTVNAIFPSFKWLANNYSIQNDSFAYALDNNDWTILTKEELNGSNNTTEKIKHQMAVYLNNDYGTQQSKVYEPVDGGLYGHLYSLSGGAAPKGFYEGHAVFYAKKKKESARKAIAIKYVHDTSIIPISYTVNLGPASIGVTPNSDKLQVLLATLSF